MNSGLVDNSDSLAVLLCIHGKGSVPSHLVPIIASHMGYLSVNHRGGEMRRKQVMNLPSSNNSSSQLLLGEIIQLGEINVTLDCNLK